MSNAAIASFRRLTPVAISRSDPETKAPAMRSLRHDTKNALQRLIAQVANTDLRATPRGAVLADEIERRIRLSARVSGVLFGLTETPGPMMDRLGTLTDAIVALMADPEQTIRTKVCISGACPPALESCVLQVAHELLTNAVKHGLHMRLTGAIEVSLEGKRPSTPCSGLTLTVSDDGCGAENPKLGEGLSLLRLFTAPYCGKLTLQREQGWTVGRLHIPGAV